jgi:hypothetical protein
VNRILFAALLVASTGTLEAQRPAGTFSWPFAIGESLEFRVKVGRLGDIGTARMWIEGPDTVSGVPTWRLRFETEAGKGPFRGSDRTSSWLDPVTFSTLRFEKRERHLLSRSEEQVSIDRATQRWGDDDGKSGPLASSVPLDELSFMYFLRTLPLGRDTTMTFTRHYDEARNPTIVRVIGHDTLTTPAGIFRTAIVEMEVRDPKHYQGTGTIRIYFSEGACRMPVRIESRMPLLGATTLTLTGWAHPPMYPGAVVCDG